MRKHVHAAKTAFLTVGAFIALTFGTIGLPQAAMAQESGQASVNNVVDFHDRGIAFQSDMYAAVQAEIARQHGYGPARVNSTTNIADEYNTLYTTNNGGQTTSGATNVINDSTTSTTTSVGSNDSNFTILPTTGTKQTTGSDINQTAGSQALETRGGNPTVSSTQGGGVN